MRIYGVPPGVDWMPPNPGADNPLLRRLVRAFGSAQATADIDLVNFPSQHSCFMFTNDLGYANVPKENRGFTMLQHQADLAAGSKPGCLVRDMSDASMLSIFQCVMSNLWEGGGEEDFTYVDVGAQYGNNAMQTAAFIKSNKRANRVYAFDCGMASLLAPYNIRMNLLDDIITFERKAVSNMSIPCQVFYREGHTEDSHIVRREGLKTSSYIVDGVTLDDYFRDHRERMVIKVDTQGADALVFEGAKGLLAREPVILTEFTPWSLHIYTDPARFLQKHARGYTLFGLADGAVREIGPDQCESFASETAAGSAQHADVLFLPRSLDSHDRIRDAIASAGNYAAAGRE